MRVSKEFKVGLLVVLGLLLLFIGVNFLKGGGIFGKDREFYAEFDNSSGLQPSNEVQLNGVKVGQVLSVELKENNPSRVIVKFSIENDELEIPDSSQIWLISSDILGTKALELKIPPDSMIAGNINYYKDGDQFYPEYVKTEQSLEEQINEQILPLKKRTEELIVDVDNIIQSVNQFWDTSASKTIDESLYEVRDAVSRFGDLAVKLSILVESNTSQISAVMGNLKKITDNLVANAGNIDTILVNLTEVSGDLADADLDTILDNTKSSMISLNQTLDDLNNPNSTLGLLMQTDSLHDQLIETNIALRTLLQDFDENPNKFVHFSLFGRKVKGYSTTGEREDLLDDMLDSLQLNKQIQYRE